MMYDLGSMIDFLLLAGLVAIAVALLPWLVHGSDAPAVGLFGMRFDAWSPVVPEEVDPLPWTIDIIGEPTVASGDRPRSVSGNDRPPHADQSTAPSSGLSPRPVATERI